MRQGFICRRRSYRPTGRRRHNYTQLPLAGQATLHGRFSPHAQRPCTLQGPGAELILVPRATVTVTGRATPRCESLTSAWVVHSASVAKGGTGAQGALRAAQLNARPALGPPAPCPFTCPVYCTFTPRLPCTLAVTVPRYTQRASSFQDTQNIVGYYTQRLQARRWRVGLRESVALSPRW